MPKIKPLPLPASTVPAVNVNGVMVKSLTVSRHVAAALLGVNIQTIDAMISAKKLRASKVARRVFVRVSALETMLDANEVRS